MTTIAAFFLGILTVFAFGSFWFWAVVVVGIIGITAFVENEKGVSAFFTLLIALLLISPVKTIFHFMLEHPGRLVLFILSYFVLGTVWGIIKWFLYVNRQLEKYNEKKTDLLRQENLTELTPALALRLKESFRYDDEVIPQARKYKSDIMLWMMYWPFSALWTLINDPVRRIFRSIYTWISTSFQTISDRMFKTAAGDMELAKQHEDAENERRRQQQNEANNQRGWK